MELDDLVLAIQAGEHRAWNELGKRLTVQLTVYFRRRVAHVDALDLVQATLLVVHRKLPGFCVEPGRPFRSWVYAVARVQVLQALHQQGRRDRLADGLGRLNRTPVTSLVGRIERVQRLGLLRRELAGLHGPYRRAILNELEGGDAGTLAVREQIKRGSARTRRRRARQMLRERLGARGALTVASTPAGS